MTNSGDIPMLTTLTQVCSAFFERHDRQTLLMKIINAMIELTHGDRGSIFLVEDLGAEDGPRAMTSLVATGMGGKEIKVDINQGIAGYVYRTGLPILVNDVQGDERFYKQIDRSTGYTTESMLSVPLRTLSGKTLGVIEVLNNKKGAFQDRDLQMLQVLSMYAAIALEHKITVDALTETNEKLRQGGGLWIQPRTDYSLKSTNARLQDVYDRLPTYAQSDSSILIEGESGTGKEVVAQMIHLKSGRRERPFVAVNCSAIPESLFEAELFGVAKGAATGTNARRGKVELAHGGTLFLDEIGELPLSAQAKLLRVLQDRTVTKVGADERPRPVDFRVVAATNRNLAEMVKEKKFREDLFYRINVVHFQLPALRERKGDIPDLSRAVLAKFLATRGWKPKTVSNAAMDRLVNFPWPGNIRQLANKLENAMILSGDRKVLEVQDFQLEWPSVNGSQGLRLVAKEGEVISDRDPIMDLARRLQFNLREAKEAFELYFIDLALRETKGNKSQAARLIGITREGLRKALMKRDNEMASLGLAVLIGGAASALPAPSADEGDESGEEAA